MSASQISVLAEPPCGPLSGCVENGVVVYRGIPYALPPVGERRFAPPVPCPPWKEVRQAVIDGPLPPQTPSRLSTVMGDFSGTQSEDCLSLTIWTPGADAAKRPVLVWFHGGAYSSGAGSLPWYSGSALAREGNIVVVGVNFRLGALGLLRLDKLSPGNLSVRDQVMALQWVQSNIAAFGGNPEAVTAGGQSSGANAIAAIAGSPRGKGLFQRAIMQSPSIGRPDRSDTEALALGKRYYQEVCKVVGSSTVDLKTVSVEHLLAAQGPFAANSFTPLLAGETALPFMPVVDNDWVLPGLSASQAVDNGCRHVLIGTTREEMMAFHRFNPRVQEATFDDVRNVFMTLDPVHGENQLAQFQRGRASIKPGMLLGDLFTRRFFTDPVLQYAQLFSASGGQAYAYQFDWPSPGGFAACHCLELPFVFGNLDDWQDAPMIQGVDPDTYAGLSRAIQSAWLAFITSGNPEHGYLPPWPPYSGQQANVMLLDSVFRVVNGL